MSNGAPILLATTIFVLQEGGNYKQFYRGDAVPGLDEEQVDRLTKCGALGSAVDVEAEAGEIDPDGGADDDADGEGADDEVVELPPKVANKPVLVQWLVDNATQEDGSAFVAEELDEQYDKAGLWELINAAVE